MRRREARRCVIGAALLLVAAASVASANTRSQQLYAKCLIPSHEKLWEESFLMLDEAVAASPNDALAVYYRGLANARLGFPDKAITDVEHALSLRPDLQPAVLVLGILYFETGQYAQAQEWWQRAYKQPATRFSAAFFLGLTKLRMGDPKGAQPLLAEAAEDAAPRQSAQDYQALAALRAGDSKGARALLLQVEHGPPDSETTQIAKQYLVAAPSAVALGAPAPGKAWSVYADAGFGYDTNVTLTPDNTTLAGQAPGQNLVNCYTLNASGQCVPLDTDGEMDGFFAVGFGGAYRLFAVELGQGSIGYDFYNSVHFQTPSFDVQNQEVHLDLSTTRQGSLQFGVSGYYGFYMLDYQSFYNQGRGVPWMTFYEGRVAATQVYYQLLGQDYSRGPFSPFRDAINNAFGVRQFFLLGAADRYLSLGYQWDDNDPLSRDGTDF